MMFWFTDAYMRHSASMSYVQGRNVYADVFIPFLFIYLFACLHIQHVYVFYLYILAVMFLFCVHIRWL